MTLKDLTDEELVRLSIEATDWEEIICKSAQPLIDEHKVKPSHVDDMITGVKEDGPYIVPTKHVALPHVGPESGALESVTGIATLKTPAVFGNEASDPVKCLFCLGTEDNMEHLNALAELTGMSEGARSYRLLKHARSAEEIMEYISKQKKEETDVYKALVCCHTDMGSGMLLKIKADQAISENGYPIQTKHGNLDSLNGFNGDLVIAMDDLANELKGKVPYALRVRNIMGKVEMKSEIEEFLTTKQG